MKFLIFSDLHHTPGKFDGGTEEDLQLFCRRAAAEKAEFVIHAGDFCHSPSQYEDYVKQYAAFPMPTYHALGNHDSDGTPLEETLRIYGMEDGHYFFDCGGYRFIVCDPNYYLHEGEYIHYNLRNYYEHEKEIDYMPPEQLEWLEKTIASAPGPCIIISHESFEREADGVKNQEAVRQIFAEANKRKPYSVLMCIAGHHHRDHFRLLDGVAYFEINSASYNCLAEGHNAYPVEYCQAFPWSSSVLTYSDPLCAVVTLEGTSIRIDGMESSYYLGIDGYTIGRGRICDEMGRPGVPRIQSVHVTL